MQNYGGQKRRRFRLFWTPGTLYNTYLSCQLATLLIFFHKPAPDQEYSIYKIGILVSLNLFLFSNFEEGPVPPISLDSFNGFIELLSLSLSSCFSAHCIPHGFKSYREGAVSISACLHSLTNQYLRSCGKQKELWSE